MTVSHRVALGFVLSVLVLTAVMLHTVLVPTALGALFAALLHPLHKRLAQRLGRAQSVSAPTVVLLAILLVVVPLVFIGLAALAHLRGLVNGGFAQTWSAITHSMSAQLEQLNVLGDSLGLDSASSFTDNLPDMAKALVGRLGDAAAATPSMLLSGFIFLLALYFFIRDGAALVRYLEQLSPFTHKHTAALVDAVHNAVRGVVLASIVSGLVQSLLVLLSQWILGVPAALLWSVSAFLMSFLPMVGTTPITVGSTLYLFFTGHAGAGICMAVASVIIGVSDNFVRPWVQGVRSSMHPLITLLSIFGGLELLGAAGVFLGPVIASIALWCFDVYHDTKTSARAAHA